MTLSREPISVCFYGTVYNYFDEGWAYRRAYVACFQSKNVFHYGGRFSGRFDEAESLFREALAIDEKAHGVRHPEVASCLNSLAALLQVATTFLSRSRNCQKIEISLGLRLLEVFRSTKVVALNVHLSCIVISSRVFEAIKSCENEIVMAGVSNKKAFCSFEHDTGRLQGCALVGYLLPNAFSGVTPIFGNLNKTFL